ncbi:S-layer homology domain-containing protein [Paenibacillus sp. SGZ-1009]|uniref:S-layer homology domain-containing protein n=1 Tax=Paenibacillus campi TaxID=3106031 RepID=UPI002AFE4033|nr:S-layer homology domain-containing protein [Paenibacillus sp. SGZ-1009]
MFKQTKHNWAALVLSAALVLPLAGIAHPITVHAASDTQHHWARQVLSEWQNKGFIGGFADGSLKPDQSVTRSQLAALINKAYGFTRIAPIQYKDVQTSDWYYNDVAIASAQGYMEGYKDSTFQPDRQVSRQELAVILTTLKKLKSSSSANTMFDTQNSPQWSKGSIGAVLDSGLMKGDEKGFRPRDITTRAEAVTVLDRSMQAGSTASTVYNSAGVYGAESGSQPLKGNVYLNAAGSTLRNVTIDGDLILGAGIGEGDILLQHITVKGTTIVNGGGSHSIHIKDSTLSTMIVNKANGTVRIVSSGSTSIQQSTLQSGAILEEQTPTAAGFQNVTLASQLPTSSTVSLKGNYDAIDVNSSGATLQMDSGSIDQLAVTTGTTNNRIALTSSSSINVLTVNAPTTVNGSGIINRAIIQSSGVTITPKVTQKTLSSGITATIEGYIVGSSQAETTVKKNDPTYTYTQPITSQPVTNQPDTVQAATYQLGVSNGQAILPDNVNYAGLNESDMKITVTLDGQPAPYLLQSLRFNAGQRMIEFTPLITKLSNYGKTVQIIVEPSGATSLLKDRYTGSFRLTGAYGQITDQAGNPIPNMQISFRQGTDVKTGPIMLTTDTDGNGFYYADLPPGAYTGELQQDGYLITYMNTPVLTSEYVQTDGIALATAEQDQIRIVLSWSSLPQDLDAHLYGPTANGFRFHISPYDQARYSYRGDVYASINTDEMDGYGPEVITINKRLDGKYMYYVKNFDRTSPGTLGTSSANVQVYIGKATAPAKSYTITPTSGNAQFWRVFDMVVENGNLQFLDYNSVSTMEPQYDTFGTIDDENELEQRLQAQADRLPANLSLPYTTDVNETIQLITDHNSDLSVTQAVNTISLIPSSLGMTVTADAYLKASAQADNIVLLHYNDSNVPLTFKVSVNLGLGNLKESHDVLIHVPTLDQWLSDAALAAQQLISANSNADTSALQTAVAQQQAVPSNATTNDKIAVLEQLKTALASW